MQAFITLDAQVENSILEAAHLAFGRHQLAQGERFYLCGIPKIDQHIVGQRFQLFQAIARWQAQEAELFLIQDDVIEMRLWRVFGFAVIDNRHQHLHGILLAAVYEFHNIGQLVIVGNDEHLLHLLPVEELLPASRDLLFRDQP